MKAITIIQPWATLIALGEKNFETRGWATKYRGPLAIHAGKKVDREACEMEPIKSTLAEYGYTADELPTGAVVAIAELTECWSVSRCLRVTSSWSETVGTRCGKIRSEKGKRLWLL
nr:ASCH domain-containing protein [Paenibacillus thiaminolyticus]